MELKMEVSGWAIFLALLNLKDNPFLEEEFIKETISKLKVEFKEKEISKDETVKEVRKLFHKIGCDPTRYRPSFEALARRILRGEPFPKIHPAVDFCNILSLKWHVPCCISDFSKVNPPLVFRAGKEGEEFESLRGNFPLEKKPLIEDKLGPFSTPITDSKRTSVSENTLEFLFLSYFPLTKFEKEKIEEDFSYSLKKTSFNLKEKVFNS